MSASGSTRAATGFLHDIRYETMRCYCSYKAVIRAVNPGKPTSGRLYCVCPHRECKFFEWLHPAQITCNRCNLVVEDQVVAAERQVNEEGQSVNSSNPSKITDLEALERDFNHFKLKVKCLVIGLVIIFIAVSAFN